VPDVWYAGPGPVRRGNKCVQDVDLTRGYGIMKDCPAPQRAARNAEGKPTRGNAIRAVMRLASEHDFTALEHPLNNEQLRFMSTRP
jgi:hypothetical protein